ncbi:MAG: SDR family oxidoreductase [Gemmatimonadota bacterium]
MPESRSGLERGGGVDLRGRTALVTGGAVRVGRAVSLGLARAGAQVVIHYNASKAEAESAVGEIEEAGGRAATVGADLRSTDAVAELADDASRPFGPIDLLVNNASVFPAERFDEVDPELWNETIAVNLRAPYFLTQALGGTMKRGGRGVIINIADLAGLQAWNAYAAHSISKAGLIQLTRVAARSLAPEVRVAAIAPGTVLPPDDMTPAEIQELADRAPLRRIGSPDDVLGAVFYIIGADFVTGEVIVVDGGRMLR